MAYWRPLLYFLFFHGFSRTWAATCKLRGGGRPVSGRSAGASARAMLPHLAVLSTLAAVRPTPPTAAGAGRVRMMASADEILRRSGPAHPPSEADRARRARRALQLGWAIRAETGDGCQGPGVQRTCARCAGAGAIMCSFCGGAGAQLLVDAWDNVHRCQCRVCSGRNKVPCPACGATGRVAAWAEELDALGDSERRV